MLEIRENQFYLFHPCSHPGKRGKKDSRQQRSNEVANWKVLFVAYY